MQPDEISPETPEPQVTSDELSNEPSIEPEQSAPKEPTSDAPAQTMEDVVAAALENQPEPDPDADAEPAQAADAKSDPSETPDGESAEPETEEARSADDDGNDTQKSEEDAELEIDPDDRELKAYQPKTRKRIVKLLSQRNEARREAQALEPDAASYREIRTYMESNQLADTDVQQLFDFGAKLRAGNFQEALKVVQPYAQALYEATGMTVPSDMREKVENGEITEEMARTLGRERGAAAHAQDQMQRQQTTQQTQQSAAQAQTIHNEATVWENEKRAIDPDFDLKADTIAAFAVSLVQAHGKPVTPEQARQLADDAYAQANQTFAAARPAPRATRPAPSSGGSQSAGAMPTPKTLEEAVLAGLNARP